MDPINRAISSAKAMHSSSPPAESSIREVAARGIVAAAASLATKPPSLTARVTIPITRESLSDADIKAIEGFRTYGGASHGRLWFHPGLKTKGDHYFINLCTTLVKKGHKRSEVQAFIIDYLSPSAKASSEKPAAAGAGRMPADETEDIFADEDADSPASMEGVFADEDDADSTYSYEDRESPESTGSGSAAAGAGGPAARAAPEPKIKSAMRNTSSAPTKKTVRFVELPPKADSGAKRDAVLKDFEAKAKPIGVELLTDTVSKEIDKFLNEDTNKELANLRYKRYEKSLDIRGYKTKTATGEKILDDSFNSLKNRLIERIKTVIHHTRTVPADKNQHTKEKNIAVAWINARLQGKTLAADEIPVSKLDERYFSELRELKQYNPSEYNRAYIDMLYSKINECKDVSVQSLKAWMEYHLTKAK